MKRAFTIIEFMVVLAIAAIIAAIAIPNFLEHGKRVRHERIYVVTTPTETYRAVECNTYDAGRARLKLVDGRNIEVHGTFTVEEITQAEKP